MAIILSNICQISADCYLFHWKIPRQIRRKLAVNIIPPLLAYVKNPTLLAYVATLPCKGLMLSRALPSDQESARDNHVLPVTFPNIHRFLNCFTDRLGMNVS